MSKLQVRRMSAWSCRSSRQLRVQNEDTQPSSVRMHVPATFNAIGWGRELTATHNGSVIRLCKRRTALNYFGLHRRMRRHELGSKLVEGLPKFCQKW